jgi:hypothetical protein
MTDDRNPRLATGRQQSANVTRIANLGVGGNQCAFEIAFRSLINGWLKLRQRLGVDQTMLDSQFVPTHTLRS